MVDEQTLPDDFAGVRRGFLWADVVWGVGFSMAFIGVSYLVYQQTGSVAATGLIIVCLNLPALAVPGLAIYLVKARGIGWVRVANTTYAVVSTALLAVASLWFTLPTWLLLLWVLGIGIGNGIYSPVPGLVRSVIVPAGGVQHFNAAVTRNEALATVIGVLAGGFVLAQLGTTWILAVTAASYLPFVLVYAVIHRRTTVDRHAPSEHIRDAFVVLRESPPLWGAFRFTVMCMFVGGYVVTHSGGMLVAVVLQRVEGRRPWARTFCTGRLPVRRLECPSRSLRLR
ncbi:MAG: hypothetical protein WCP26_08535 [Actinomycetes bacterium]